MTVTIRSTVASNLISEPLSLLWDPTN
uniref:Uncharacterized protein n=1 Tax=Arundo donax TaxID=35708 RepID=A0A0A8YL32_ARUDO